MQSCAPGDFLKVYERPRIGGDLCDGSFSETAPLQSAGGFCAFFSGSEIPFPGNGDRKRQRLGSNAGYAEGSPSMWCCRDHPLAVRAQNLIDDFNFTLHSLDRPTRSPWNCLSNELLCCSSVQ